MQIPDFIRETIEQIAFEARDDQRVDKHSGVSQRLPITVTEKIPVTNTPNIFSYRSYVFAKNPALVRRFIKATKADVGGVGGHVVAADTPSVVAMSFWLRAWR